MYVTFQVLNTVPSQMWDFMPENDKLYNILCGNLYLFINILANAQYGGVRVGVLVGWGLGY